ncbi:MAG: DUF501 domain-containing protein [Aquificae bacterium]|nr:DUF501 domain-containing protein [Aquificota bacterium]
MRLEAVETPLVIYENGLYRPEPTRFWILDPELRKAISALESEGYIKYWSEKITHDPKLYEFFVKLHEKEVEKRKKLLKERFPEVFKGTGKWDLVCKRVLLNPEIGIGGIRNFRAKPFKVRCLHLWTAYHLGDEEFKNPIGEFVLSKVLTSQKP